MKLRRYVFLVLLALLAAGTVPQLPGPLATEFDVAAQSPPAITRQTVTRLTDGRLLVLGGETVAGALGAASLVDPVSQRSTPLPAGMLEARSGHSATLLPDGSVLIVGGRSAAGQTLASAERFDPSSETFVQVPLTAAAAREMHTATVLTDGRVLIVGGTANIPTTLVAAEIWDVDAGTVTPVGGDAVVRAGHTARLLADGRVQITGGVDEAGQPVLTDSIFAPGSNRLAIVTRLSIEDADTLVVTDSVPVSHALAVPVDVRIALRVSRPLLPSTVTSETFVVSGPNGQFPVAVTAAEMGRLVFVRPAGPLAPATKYELTVDGATDAQGTPLVAALVFETADTTPVSDRGNDDQWVPDADSIRNGWRTNLPKSPWETWPPLLAAPGTTAVAGRVLTLDGQPLRDVTLAIDGAEARTDQTGRFLLTVTSGVTARRELEIDGSTASRGQRRYGFFEYGLTVTAGETNVLPFTIWMPRLDIAHEVVIPSPTTTETVIATPYIPGLELHLPAGAVIVGEDGTRVTKIGITPIPVDRPPFPLPANVEVPVYFTIQPGGAYVRGGGGAWLVYPNYRGAVPEQRIQFYHYDPDELSWYVYGLGTVAANGTQVIPDRTTRLYEFTGAMINSGNSPPNIGATPGGPDRADPVDPSTGVFVLHKTDLYLPDTMPLALGRTYNSGDNLARPFGRGMTHPYAMFLWSAFQYQEADLILPEGGRIHYVRTSPGNGFVDAVMVHQETATTSATPTAFYKSVLQWNGFGWDLTLEDGTVYVFGENTPLQSIRDRYGNQTTLTWSQSNGISGYGNILRVTSPNGRWISFTYDTSNRVTQAQDNIGRTVTYTYDANGNLATVTDPENHLTTYTYNAANRMETIKDGRDIVYVTNQYDTAGRVITQTLADPSHVYQFAYTLDGSGKITQTDLTDPRGHVERLTFNSNRYVTADTQALGTPQQRTFTFERQTGSNLVMATVDALNRRTEFTYDDSGYVLTITRLAGTADAVTTSYTYEPLFHQLATVTDPLNHTWTREYDGAGRLTGIVDPLTHRTGVTLNAAGQITQTADALQQRWQFGYRNGDLVSRTDPLNRVATQFVDGGGRVLNVTDASGRSLQWQVDKLNRVTSVTDALGGVTSFAYDPNGRLLTLTDALNHPTDYTYDNSDRPATRTDPLQQGEIYSYDGLNNLTGLIDRKGQPTAFSYDALDRLQLTTFADMSTVEFVYDAGDRLRQVIDSTAGAVVLEYDLLDRVTSETTPEGTVGYTYDADSRRSAMTVAGQPAVTYDYDAAHRLFGVHRDALTASITYDDADRRETVTLPNGLVTTYGWDAAGQLTGLTYTQSSTVLGTLTYDYDAAGNRIGVGGTWARTGLPAPVSSALYDAANRLVEWNGAALTYDDNGNLIGDGANTYTWNARDELVALSGGVTAAFEYDGMGRRRSKNVAGASTRFLYDEFDAIQELTGSGTTSANLFSGLGVDEVFTRLDGDGSHHILSDALGSAIALTGPTGAVQTEYSYAPFGATTQSGTASTNPSQFTGRENDGSALYYYRGRYLHTAMQRYLSEDPLGFEGGDINLYAYVFDAPTMLTDPSGELAPLAGVVARVVGAAAIRCLMAGAQSALIDYASSRKIDWGSAAADCALGALMPGESAVRNATKAAGRTAAKRTSRAARREAMRRQNIPTSRPPVSQTGPEGRRQLIYEGGDGKPKVVTQHPADANHPDPHWHAADPKMDGGQPQRNRHGQVVYGSGGTSVPYSR
jgi:RHS repeat-associated protein